uniref:Uncharacterized protein n=1 Tax=Cacopsylla melanoneura TaxID=428564 RepID=A0A8D8U0X6_9HEMI
MWGIGEWVGVRTVRIRSWGIDELNWSRCWGTRSWGGWGRGGWSWCSWGWGWSRGGIYDGSWWWVGDWVVWSWDVSNWGWSWSWCWSWCWGWSRCWWWWWWVSNYRCNDRMGSIGHRNGGRGCLDDGNCGTVGVSFVGRVGEVTSNSVGLDDSTVISRCPH